MRNKIFYGLGLLTISTFGFMVNTNALTIDKDTTLTANVTDGIVVESGRSVTIDLGGFDVSNVNGDHTIKIKEGASVVITGSGTVTNDFDKKAPVYNDGTVTIEGGTFKRTDGTNNSYYVLLNHGTMIIENGIFSVQNGKASLIDNGWYEPSVNVSKKIAKLTINGGTFEMNNNDKYIKNDDYGVMEVNGGTFNMYKPSSAVIANVGSVCGKETLTVNGGTFNYYGTGNPDNKGYAIWDYDWGTSDKSVTIVKGGKYNLVGDSVAGITNATIADGKNEFKVIGSDQYILVTENELVEKVEVTTLDDSNIIEEDKSLVEKVVNEKKYTVVGYYDIELFKSTANDLKVEQIYEADNAVSIKLELPSTLAKVQEGYKRTYYVIRVHDGVTTVIDAVDNGDGTISFKSDKFSTYSVVYTDEKIKKVTNPETTDNTLVYFVVATVSVVGLSVSGILLKKRFN